MSSDDIETASQALRELARWVIRDGVDSDHLEDYMLGLLNKHLIELHATCRYQAPVVARCFAGLPARDLAAHLCRSACELERTRSALGTLTPRKLPQQPTNPVSARRRGGPIQGRPSDVPECGHLCSWFPELVAALVFSTLGVLLLKICDDSALGLVAASGIVCLGLIYTLAAIHLAWRNAHADGQR
ncbi:MAG: hypothetical protein JWL69_4431 [Phycisphaerales bacterium]|nr:hypothetical protein [Phycisphaerales bacterium]MDB5358551.1 hypothetical protein [Phycisphaerales bacterium]